MAYQVIKRINGHPYLYEQTSFREGAKIRTRCRCLGRINDKEATRFKKTKIPIFLGYDDLTLQVFEDLNGKSIVSREYIENLIAQPKLKQAEKELLKKILDEFNSKKIPVHQFADKVKNELLVLNEKIESRYGDIALPWFLGGQIAEYFERVYEAPLKTKAGDLHFDGSENYFAHTRIEDMKDGENRRIIEIQSDLFQKGQLQNEIPSPVDEKPEIIREGYKRLREWKIKKLEPLEKFKNCWHLRIIQEEIKKAAADGKKNLLFPGAETIAIIQGYIERTEDGYVGIPLDATPGDKFILANDNWAVLDAHGSSIKAVKYEDITFWQDFKSLWIWEVNAICKKISKDPMKYKAELREIYGQKSENLVKKIQKKQVDVLAIGKQIANAIYTGNLKRKPTFEEFAKFHEIDSGTGKKHFAILDRQGEETIAILAKNSTIKTMEKVKLNDQLSEEQRRVVKFYSETISQYLTKTYTDVKKIRDEKNFEWFKVPITRKNTRRPISAFG